MSFEDHAKEKDRIRMRDSKDPLYLKAIKKAFAGELFPIPQKGQGESIFGDYIMYTIEDLEEKIKTEAPFWYTETMLNTLMSLNEEQKHLLFFAMSQAREDGYTSGLNDGSERY